MARLACRLWWVPVLLAAGCSAGQITSWQRSLEMYVADEGNGDPNVLRNMDRSPSESDFGVFGKRQGLPFGAKRRTDTHGELVGYERFNDLNWFIFLVGTVQYRGGAFVTFPMDDPSVTDIRLVAFSGTGGAFRWIVSQPDAEAHRVYCQPQLELWRRSHDSRSETDTAPMVFPTPKDDFQVTLDPDTLSVVDQHSGARWSMPIPVSGESD